ncbi:MAG: winged helix-turn-helix transcriptional regulator [Planctomycetales bacterium]|nr:winged helix-turn-helix transcriptional regulator [Planctomycetales bacterium]MBN8626414.1 winged helix-turn-helix transcriptional regulator [Planctomycetota bacterium]
MLTTADFQLAAAACEALGNPLRLAVLVAILRGTKRPGCVAQKLRVPPSRVSEALAPLIEAGILRKQRDGRAVKYELCGEWIETKFGIACRIQRGPIALQFFVRRELSAEWVMARQY